MASLVFRHMENHKTPVEAGTVYGPRGQEDVHVATQVVAPTGYDETAEAHPSRRSTGSPRHERMMCMWAYHYVTRRTAVVVKALCRRSWKRVRCESDGSNGETDCNGRKLGPNMTTHEFFILEKRNEVKQAQLAWNTSSNRWWANWQNVQARLI